MIESHPFEAFVPANASVLIIGSFPELRQTRKLNNYEEWLYSAKRNQFRKIIESVYKRLLKTVDNKKQLFAEKGIAITDIILKAERRKEGNLDEHLHPVEYNTEIIKTVLDNGSISRILFTGKFVEKYFTKLFPDYNNTDYLPSPSPRYARISLQEKSEIYKRKLPQ